MQNSFKRLFLYVILPLFGVLFIYQVTGHNSMVLRSFLAASPIVVVLVAMLFFRLGGQIAGPIGWIAGIFVGILAFGATPRILWVSQEKGLLLSLFVIAIFFPALMLYNTVNEANGIQSIVRALECLITDRSILLVTTAWAFSSLMEGVAGFGLPVAIVSPMLVGMGVSPIMAVAAVAVGHAWSVTFGDMGVVFQTLTSVVKIPIIELEMYAVILLGIACLLCGLAAAHILKSLNRWLSVVAIGIIMASTQYLMVMLHVPALASMFAGAVGVLGGITINLHLTRRKGISIAIPIMTPALSSALLSYGMLALIMILISVLPALNKTLGTMVWKATFPEVTTLDGFVTAAVPSQTYHPLLHPGTSILIVAILSYWFNRWKKLYPAANFSKIMAVTWNTSWSAMVGIFSMVGLSSLMDHSGMTMQLAGTLSNLFKSVFPLISPIIGMIGAFATGSNNNSNVLFAPLQQNIATLLKISPAIIVAAQTTGGSLGSMVAPAKIIVGCSTVGLQGRDGDVLRITIPYGLGIGVLMGIVTLMFVQ
jgi:lactate permease